MEMIFISVQLIWSELRLDSEAEQPQPCINRLLGLFSLKQVFWEPTKISPSVPKVFTHHGCSLLKWRQWMISCSTDFSTQWVVEGTTAVAVCPKTTAVIWTFKYFRYWSFLRIIFYFHNEDSTGVSSLTKTLQSSGGMASLCETELDVLMGYVVCTQCTLWGPVLYLLN